MPLALTLNGSTEYLTDDQSPSAMLRYWTASQAGDPTAALKKIAVVPDSEDDDPTPPPTAPGAISSLAQTRIAQQETWLDKAGFQVDPPLFAPGTRVLKLGDQNFKLFRQEVHAMPLFGEATAQVTATIQSEQRHDRDVPLSELEMSNQGTLFVGNDELSLEVGAFSQLANLVGFGSGARYLADHCPPELRAENVNIQLELARRRKDRTLTLRTRLNRAGRRSVFATVTPSYTSVDSHAVLGVVAPALSDARTELSYDGSGVKATALWMPETVVDLAAGDIFRVGLRITSDDSGRGRIRISGVVWRNRCLNLIIIGQGEVETVSQVHRGDPALILERVAKGVEAAREKVADFLEAWGHARTVKIENPEEELKKWVHTRRLKVPGIRSEKARDELAQDLIAAWRKEPGETLADCVNAVTRTAHASRWDRLVQEALERQAAELVLVPR